MELLTVFFVIASYLICFYSGRASNIMPTAESKVDVRLKNHDRSGIARAVVAAVRRSFRNIPRMSSDRIVGIVFFMITVAAVGVRLWKLGEIPYGLNQDEASIGYDSFAIGTYGYDRNGFHLPIYPIAFGDGHGPLYTYLSIPAIRMLGLSLFSVRITNALLSCTAAVLSYFLVKRLTKSRSAALIGFALIATAPALIISGRWALDGCPPPSLFIIGLFLYVRAVDLQKTRDYGLTALFFSLLCYSYGPAGMVVPVFLIISSIYLLIYKKMTPRQLLICILLFTVMILPLAVFMYRNLTGMPAVHGFISFPKFTVMRTSTALSDRSMIENILDGINRILFQPQDLIWNMVPGYGTTYLFTAPLILFGIIVLFRRMRRQTYSHLFLIAAYMAAGLIMCGLIEQNVNRISVIYPAVLLLITLAVHAVLKQHKGLAMLLGLFFVLSFAGFTRDYFGKAWQEDFGNAFFYSFGDALEFAMEKTSGTIYVTERDQNEPSIIALFYSRLPPERFYTTVRYYDDQAEWRNAMYFDRFRFGIPEEKDPNAVYIINPAYEGYGFDPAVFTAKSFPNYTVMYNHTF